jgi:hypothetical protein
LPSCRPRQRAQHPDQTHRAIPVRNLAKGSPVRPRHYLRDWQISLASCQMGQRSHLHLDKTGITIRTHHFQDADKSTIYHDSGIQVELTIQTADRCIQAICFRRS